MKRKPVDSSMLASVGYDPSTQTLEMEFKDGGAIWQYLDVPEPEYTRLIGSSSLGSYARDLIIGQYAEVRISRKKR
jgi:KTSC domain